MNIDPLLLIYKLLLDQGGDRAPAIERYLEFDISQPASEDDKINEQIIYSTLFNENLPRIERIFINLLEDMRGTPFEQCDTTIDGLALLQSIISTALWKYHQNVGETLEHFARDFDRLDVPEERVRLYKAAGSKGSESLIY